MPYINDAEYSSDVLAEGAILSGMVAEFNEDPSTIHDLAERLQAAQSLGHFTIKRNVAGGNYSLMLDRLYFPESAPEFKAGHTLVAGVLHSNQLAYGDPVSWHTVSHHAPYNPKTDKPKGFVKAAE
jgi:hypothetical protein